MCLTTVIKKKTIKIMHESRKKVGDRKQNSGRGSGYDNRELRMTKVGYTHV